MSYMRFIPEHDDWAALPAEAWTLICTNAPRLLSQTLIGGRKAKPFPDRLCLIVQDDSVSLDHVVDRDTVAWLEAGLYHVYDGKGRLFFIDVEPTQRGDTAYVVCMRPVFRVKAPSAIVQWRHQYEWPGDTAPTHENEPADPARMLG
jgi:hypothetical protein